MERETYTAVQAADRILGAMRPGFITHLGEVLASTGEEKIPGGVIDGMVEKILENINFSNAMPEVTVDSPSETSSTATPTVFDGAEAISDVGSSVVTSIARAIEEPEEVEETLEEPTVRCSTETESFEDWVDRASQRLTA